MGQKRRRDGGRGLLAFDEDYGPWGWDWTHHWGVPPESGSMNRRALRNFRPNEELPPARRKKSQKKPLPPDFVLTGSVEPLTRRRLAWAPGAGYTKQSSSFIYGREDGYPRIVGDSDNLAELREGWVRHYSDLPVHVRHRQQEEHHRRMERARDHRLGRFVRDRMNYMSGRRFRPIRPLTSAERAHTAEVRAAQGVTPFPPPTGRWQRQTELNEVRQRFAKGGGGAQRRVARRTRPRKPKAVSRRRR